MKPLFAALFAILVSLLSANVSHAGDIFMGEGYAFGVSTPAGWEQAKPDFAPVMFYPAGSSADHSPVIIYVRSVSKAETGAKTPEQLNAQDLKGMRGQWPKVRSNKSEVLFTRSKTAVPTYTFRGGGAYFEIVGYVDHPQTITVIVLSAETEKELAASKAAFRSVVSSYQWLPELAGSGQ